MNRKYQHPKCYPELHTSLSLSSLSFSHGAWRALLAKTLKRLSGVKEGMIGNRPAYHDTSSSTECLKVRATYVWQFGNDGSRVKLALMIREGQRDNRGLAKPPHSWLKHIVSINRFDLGTCLPSSRLTRSLFIFVCFTTSNVLESTTIGTIQSRDRPAPFRASIERWECVSA